MQVTVPELGLVVMIGASSAGKTTFARRFFKPTEIVSSDVCRGLVSDDENSMDASDAAFELLHTIVRLRLARGLLTVVDATNVSPEARRPLVQLARDAHVFATAIVLDLPERTLLDRASARPDRAIAPHAVRHHRNNLRRGLRDLKGEGFRWSFFLRSEEDVAAATLERTRLWVNRREARGPFDLIGDVHGCYTELVALIAALGYTLAHDGARWSAAHPDGRTLVFVGDLVDRGPQSAEVLELVMDLVQGGQALCVNGNHEARLLRHLRGHPSKLSHGLAETLASLEPRDAAFKARVADFCDGLLSHYVLDEGRLIVAHAGLKEEFHGRTSGAVRSFALYGETTGEIDEYGLPVRANWAAGYRGRAMVVHGHVPVVEAEWLNNTIDLDTGCCFGGKLSALRYPERELCSVPAARVYYEPIRPLAPPPEVRSAQQEGDDLLDMADLLGEHHVHTRHHGTVRVPGDRAAAIEVMSRFAVDPRWLVYLPPTMAPCETSARRDLLEHPDEAFAWFVSQGVSTVVCQEKHMGSRAIVVLARDADAARRAFGVTDGQTGQIYTRTGRRFFEDDPTQTALLERVGRAMRASGLWEELETDWVVLDAELLPWSAKAVALLRQQYAPVGVAAIGSLQAANTLLEQAAARGLEVSELRDRTAARLDAVRRYDAAWRRYCWDLAGPDDLILAPFHLLASEGRVHTDRDHVWHMDTLARLAVEPGLKATAWRRVNLTEPDSVAEAVAWWTDLTGAGGEGMVIKPLDFITRGPKGLVQPAIKCRGAEYLRIIYGPEYLMPEHLERLRKRGTAGKRGLALREFALGIEALERFVARAPLRSVHAAVFGVLALETEPMDPRL